MPATRSASASLKRPLSSSSLSSVPSTPPQKPKRVRTPKTASITPTPDGVSPFKPTPQQLKKATLLSSHGTSRFASFASPTHEECEAIADALAACNGGMPVRPEKLENNPERAGCGAVTSVLDAVVRTVLSCNTSDRNSSAAKRSLDLAFSRQPTEHGPLSDSAFYARVAAAPASDIAEAIKCGGLAKNKSVTIKSVLELCVSSPEGRGKHSLEWLREKSDKAVMEVLLGVKGVGPKVVACVLLFAMGRDSFALDTHIYRLGAQLAWFPLSASREDAQAHLDVRIPDHLKYPLHILLIRHGKTCAACQAKGSKDKSAREGCPLLPFKGGRWKGAGVKAEGSTEQTKSAEVKKVEEVLEEMKTEVKAEGLDA